MCIRCMVDITQHGFDAGWCETVYRFTAIDSGGVVTGLGGV